MSDPAPSRPIDPATKRPEASGARCRTAGKWMIRVGFVFFVFFGFLPGGRGEEGGPRYRLPADFSRGEGLPPPLEGAVARAIGDVTRPSAPWAAGEGWKVLAGIGRGAAPAAVEALPGADWFGRSLLVRALGSMEEPDLEPVLVAAAGDPAWAVRAAAAEGLGLCDGAASARVLPGLLRDETWRVRRTAVEAVRRRALRGSLPRGTAADELLPLAADTDVDVRRTAWLALADLREPRAREPLREALAGLSLRLTARSQDDEPDPELATAVRLLRGLAEGFGEDPSIRELLRDLGRSPTHPLAGAAMREWFREAGPAAAGDGEAVADLVTIFLHPGTDTDSRAAAEEAIVRVGEPAAAELLARIATPERARRPAFEPEGGVTREALRLVLRLRGNRAAETLEGVLREEGLSRVLRMHAADLGRRTCPAALGRVFRDLLESTERSGGLDAQLLKGAAASGGDDLPGLMARYLVLREGDEPPRHLRAAAAEVLERRPDLRDPAALRRALDAEADGDILGRLLRMLPETEGEAALPVLERFLGDPRLRVRLAAVDGLGRLPGERSTGLLFAHLGTESGEDDRLPWHGGEEPTEAQRAELDAVKEGNAGTVREAVVSSLRFAVGPGARTLLEGLLRHADPHVREAASSNLATMGDPAAAPALAAAVAVEGDHSLRGRLLSTLASLGGPDADAAFEACLASPDPSLRSQALGALGGEKARARAPRGLRALLEPDAADAVERLEAFRALGRTADAALVPFLRHCLATVPSNEERRAVLEALGFARDAGSVEAVAALLPAGPPGRLDVDTFETAAMAVETLGDLRSPEGVPVLAGLLRRTLPPALSGWVGPSTSRERQLAVLCLNSLGRCGGDGALAVLAEAAFHPGFSRGAEAATSNPLRPPIPRRDGERWRAELPDGILDTATALAGALARWKEGPLAAALERRLAELRADGRAFAVGEEWLVWLGEALASPSKKLPARPRWWAKVALARQVHANPPRLSEADAAAAFTLWSHDSTVSREYAAARRELAAWREGTALHEPLRFERERALFAGLDAVAAAGEALRAETAGADAGPMLAAWEESGREDAVARLGVDVLTDLGVHHEAAVALGERAVASDAGYWPNLRSLGKARYAAGDAGGAAEMFGLALEEAARSNRDGAMQRSTAWTRFYYGRALERAGERDGALAALGLAALLSDVVMDFIDRDPALEELRRDERFAEAMGEARKAFAE